MKIAVVGSRKFKHLNVVNMLIMHFDRGVTIVSGGGGDVDLMAERVARDNGLSFIPYPADWDQYGKAAGPIRNAQIVEACDMLIAFWDGKSKGTKNSIDKARKERKPVFIYEANNDNNS